MTAKLILPPERCGPDHPEWFEARRAGITASEIAGILGLSKHESARSLYHHKRGETPDEPDNDAKRWGRRLEAPIADEFADRHPEFTIEFGGLYGNADRPWQMATPDRLIFDTAAPELTEAEPVSLLEIKTSGSFDEWGDDGGDDIPVAYRCQVLWQMDVLGLTEARVALLVSGQSYREYTVPYDPDDAALMRDTASDFLDALDLEAPPDVDAHTATGEALKHLHPDIDDTEVEVSGDLADEYAAACQAERAAKDRKKLAENRLREAAGRGRYVMSGGRKVATRVKTVVAPHWRAESTRDYYTPSRRKQ